VQLSDVALFYREVGRGEPMIVLHGGPGSDHTYLRAFDRLGEFVRLIYFDLRGNGRSASVPEDAFTFELLCQDIDRIADHLGCDRFGLIGQSFGGYLALEYALRKPTRLTRLVLADTAPRFSSPEEHEQRGQLILARWPHLRTVVEAPWNDDDDAEVARQIAELAPIFFHRYDPDRAAANYRDVIWRAAPILAGEVILRGWDVTPRLAEISVPTLILAGRHDIMVSCDHARTMWERIAGSTMCCFEDSGHNAFIEEPEAFFSTLEAWLRATA